MNKNKNVSIWRGDTPPPSKFHLWLKNNKLYHNDGIDWIENEIDNASNENSGLMSKEDKERLDNLVYDGLDSNDQNRALSANLGNVLLGKIETIKLSAYKVKGSVENISDIPLIDILLGDVYNILNSFYIDNKKYPEGTNVVWTGTLFDPLGGTVDFKDYSTTEQIEEIITTLENNINNSLDNLNSIKSDKTYVNEQLATKANITYVDNKVSPKADKTYVDEQLTTKASITYVDNKVSPKADTTYVNEQLATKANTGYVNTQVEILTTALETKVDKVSGKGLSTNDYTTTEKNLVATISNKADKTYTDAQLATKVDKIAGKGLSTNDYTTEEKNLVATINNKSDKGLLCIGLVDNLDNFLSRIENHSIVTNPSILIITATYKVGNGTGTFIALLQVRTNNSGDGGGTTIQYIYADKARLTRYIDFTSTRIILILQTQIDNARNLQYQNSTISLTDMWGLVIGSTIDLSWGDKTAIREGTSTASQVQLTITKPFGNTTSTYLTPASSAKAGIMTAEMYNKLNNLVCDNLESDRGDLALSAKLGKILSNVVNTNKSAINTKLQEEITRATNAESTINAKVEAEITRATTVENNLRETINNITAGSEQDTIDILARLQGTSINQDGYKDPVFSKEFTGNTAISNLNTWLNNQFFAIKDGVYYRNGQSGTYTISKDVPQCLININCQGVKLYVFNAPRSFATGTFELIAFGVKPISGGGDITWGSGICRRQSTYNFSSQQATWSAWENITSDVNKAYVDRQLATKANKTDVNALGDEISQSVENTNNALTEISSRLTNVENVAGVNVTYEGTAVASNMFIQDAQDFLSDPEMNCPISNTPDAYAAIPISEPIYLKKGNVITTPSVCYLVKKYPSANIVNTLVWNAQVKYEATEDMTVYLAGYDYMFPMEYTVKSAIDNIKDNINSINSSISYLTSSKASTTYVDNKVSPKADKTYVDEEIRKKVSYEELERYPNQIYNRFTNFDSKEVSPMSFYTWNNGDGGYGGSHPILKTCIEHYNEEMFAFDESNSTFLWFDWDNTKKKWIYQGQTCRDFSDSDIEEENRKHIDLETPSLAYLLSTPYLAMHLRELYLHISTIIKNDEDTHSYGIQFDTSVSSPTCTRIGSLTMHKTLPIQSKMRGCLLSDYGTVHKYLNHSDWTKETRDGKYGQVMVEIPEHYRKCTQEGTICTVRLSELPIEGYQKIPKMYVSAYEASIQRSTGKLCSVVNTTTDYRGGNNTSAYDGTYRSLLGMPITNLSRTEFRDAARKRNNGDERWNMYMYHVHKAIFWLFATEYATLNSQASYNAELTAEGYRQGGLGAGVTNLGLDWNAHNGYNPMIPCGCTDALGNSTGEVTYNVMKSDGTVGYAAKVARYRGIENPFGHIWKWADGINIEINPTTANGGNNLSKVYVREYGSGLSDTGYSGYTHVGNGARTYGYVKQIIFGNGGEIIPSVVGGSSTTYFCDNHWTSIPSTSTLRGVLFGGTASIGASAGLVSAYSHNVPSNTSAYFGSRLCFLA